MVIHNDAVFPEQITVLLALIEIVGLGFAVIVITELPKQPLTSEPDTLYVVLEAGDTVYVVLFELSVQVYVEAPLNVSVTVSLGQMAN
jgi:hypothetical protein